MISHLWASMRLYKKKVMLLAMLFIEDKQNKKGKKKNEIPI